MPMFSWTRWLRNACGLLTADERRKLKPRQTTKVEGLEERTLLTAPVAVDDAGYTVDEDLTLNGTSVLANDTDVDDDIAGAVLDSGPSHAASFTFNPADGTFTYTPAADFVGTDTFTYHAVDGTPEDSNIATVTITVGQVNDAGVFGGDISGTGAEDTDITGTLTFADTADGFTTPNFGVSVPATNGIANINATTGEWTYTPSANFNGSDSFTVSVTDDDGNVETQVISLTVTAVNDAGVFGGDTSDTGAEDADITGTLTFADTADGFTTPNFGVSVPATNGTANINATTGEWTYTPSANFNGADSFTVSVTDDDGNVETQVITIGVTQVNDSGVFGGDVSGTAAEDNNITGTLTFADTADGFTNPNFSVSVAATQGTASIDSTTGAWTYTPNANFNGSDSFTVSVTDDDGNVETQVISLTVTAVNDAPVANAQSFTISKNLAANGTLTGTDVEGSNLTFAAGATQAAHGTVVINANGTFTYTPATDYTGPDSFSFIVNDGTANSTEATVTITVEDNVAPVATADSFTTNEDTVHNGTLAGTDGDGDTLTFAAGTVAAAHGTVVINPNGSYTYTPAANYNGPDSFSFLVNDGLLNSTEATITVTVTAVNDAPVGTAASYNVGKNTPFQGTLAGTDIDGNVLTFAAGAVAAAHGTVVINANGTFTYTPATDYTGPDSFSFVANDGTVNSAEATITLTVLNNTLPTATPATFTTTEDTPHSGTLTGADGDADPLTFHAGTIAPAHGTVVINTDGTFTYTPAANSHGGDVFSFYVNDGFGNSQEALVKVRVTAAEDAPVVTGAALSTPKNTNLQGTLTGTDSDGDSVVFAVGTVTPAHGTVVIHPDGSFTYTPTANYTGPDSFSFTASDGLQTSTEATITITVTANVLPVANAGSFTTDEDTPLNGSLTATDADSDPLTYQIGAVTPAHGTVVINANGTFTYTPAANYFGSDTFTFRANDGTGNSPEATVTITVTAVNDAPTVTNGVASVNEDAVLNGSVSTLGVDAEASPLTYVVVAQPTHGTLTLNPDGTFVYTPTGNYSGPDSFTFKANDGQADSNVGTFDITVTAVNDPLTLTLPGPGISVNRNSQPVQLDPNAAVTDADTNVSYSNAQITVSVLSGNTADDNKHGRFTLSVISQGTGAGLVKVKGNKIYFSNSISPVATFTGGSKGKNLVITFTGAATPEAVNAILKQLSAEASKKASTGARSLEVKVTAQGQTATSTKTVTVA